MVELARQLGDQVVELRPVDQLVAVVAEGRTRPDGREAATAVHQRRAGRRRAAQHLPHAGVLEAVVVVVGRRAQVEQARTATELVAQQRGQRLRDRRDALAGQRRHDRDDAGQGVGPRQAPAVDRVADGVGELGVGQPRVVGVVARRLDVVEVVVLEVVEAQLVVEVVEVVARIGRHVLDVGRRGPRRTGGAVGERVGHHRAPVTPRRGSSGGASASPGRRWTTTSPGARPPSRRSEPPRRAGRSCGPSDR